MPSLSRAQLPTSYLFVLSMNIFIENFLMKCLWVLRLIFCLIHIEHHSLQNWKMFFLPSWFFYYSCVGFSITNERTFPIKLAFRRGTICEFKGSSNRNQTIILLISICSNFYKLYSFRPLWFIPWKGKIHRSSSLFLISYYKTHIPSVIFYCPTCSNRSF